MAKERVPYSGPIVTRVEAISTGLKRYFTGEPCKAGHMSERGASHGRCFTCLALKTEAWTEANPGAQQAREKVRRLANPAINRAKCKAYRAANLEASRAQSRAWANANSAQKKANAKAWAEANRDLVLSRSKAWAKANPGARRAHDNTRRARKTAAGGQHTAADIKALFAAQKGKCAYCGVSIKAGWHVDHVVPLSKGGSNWPSNLALACQPCNLRKHSKHPIDFARERGLLL